MCWETIKVATGEGWTEIEALKIVPGLAIHPALVSIRMPLERYSITHIPSGYSLGFPGPILATLEKVIALSKLGNWDRPQIEISADKELISAGRKVLKIE